ncbi:MAG: lysylphosphatidylglycerol synthase domain-containing protein [Stellaceae bacterium]
MKLVSVSAAILGLAVIAGLVIHFGAGAVTHSLLALGAPGFAAICLIQLAVIAAMGIAWWALLPGTSPWAEIWGRLVRDSASEVLPLSQVGGYVLGARALAFCGVAANRAAASTIVDVSLEFFAQLAYTAIALGWLLHLDPRTRFAAPAGFGLLIGCGLAGGFLAAQRRGLGVLDRFAGALGRGWAERTAAGAAALHTAIAEIYARSAAVWASFLLHLICWIASAAEIWLALRLMKAPLGFGVVLVIESLLYAVRSAAFAVPNAVGVQEGAYILLGAGFGLTPETALALSLLKRGRDFAIGLPVLGAYQLVESGRLWRRAGRAAVPNGNARALEAKPRSR